ncbi:Nucleotidyltransferase domain protein (plasmid) [Roseovarius sp. THAF8]|uniref:nucleotidyltransferase domain-containing protein n=1 Tax=Roseovarius sp. THAF8 TaxID=2587846 RepID=UPI0012694EFC|nr:nucleotidyltransferase domain-containing protein [Roseovarius sp. THAF8]QFT99966.1 Nucleotidyltransferase domain protein [Roseovarius sp. THAF8]
MTDYSECQPLLDLVVQELDVAEIWLFGSRARGDHRENSDWDLLIVLNDDAQAEHENLKTLWELKRRSGVPGDLFPCRKSDFDGCKGVVNTLSYIAWREGVRLV